MSWHLAPAAVQLRNEIDFLWPNRSKKSDGTIGDAAHSARDSHHNPDDDDRSVNAFDATHHPGVFDAHGFVRWLVAQNDPRVIEVISNGQIWTRAKAHLGWRPYGGSNKHLTHAHISFSHAPALEDSMAPYGIERFFDRTITPLTKILVSTEEDPDMADRYADSYFRINEPAARPGDLGEGSILADNSVTLTWLDPEDWQLVLFLHALANKTPEVTEINQAMARHMQRRRLDPVAVNAAARAVLAELALPPSTAGIDPTALAAVVKSAVAGVKVTLS